MRILFDARRSRYHATGIGRVVDGLLHALVTEGQQHQFLVLFGEKNPLNGLQAPNFEFRQVRLEVNSPAVNLVMPYLAQQWQADVAYYPFWLMPLVMPCPSVVTIHDLLYTNYVQYLSYPRRIFYAAYTSLALRAVTRIQSVSYFTRSDLLRLFRISPSCIDVIPNSVDSLECQDGIFASWHHTDTVTTFLPDGPSRPFGLYVGNHKPHKNLERLLRAYRLIADATETDLVIVGAKSSYENLHDLPYVRLVQQLGLQNRVHFLGQISDAVLAHLYGGARFLVFPSLYEGFGLPALEAMHYGTPVACSNTTSLPEVVGDAALTFDPLSERQIAGAMLTLDQSPELRANLAQRGHKQATLFSWRESARQWLSSMERAVEYL